MFTVEEYNQRIGEIREMLGEEQGALVTDRLAELVNDYTDVHENYNQINNLLNEREEYAKSLLQENARLFKRVGVTPQAEIMHPDDVTENVKAPSVEDLINITE